MDIFPRLDDIWKWQSTLFAQENFPDGSQAGQEMSRQAIGRLMVLCFVPAGIVFFAPTLSGQSTLSVFQRCSGYAQSISELNSQFNAHRARAGQLVSRRSDLLLRLEACKQDLVGLKVGEVLHQLSMLQVEFEKQSVRMEATTTNFEDQPAAPGSALLRNREFLQPLSERWKNIEFRIGLGIKQSNEISASQRVTLQRKIKVVQELYTTIEEMDRLRFKQFELFNKYFELADVTGFRSEIENRAAVRELEKADTGNLGAVFALAIAMRRLNRVDESLALLTRFEATNAHAALAAAARSEIEMSLGNHAAARKLQHVALAAGRNDVRVRLLCAQSKSAGHDLKSAIPDWEFVAKHGDFETEAHRSLALIYASFPEPTKHHAEMAHEHSKLACALAADQNWGCLIARALAHSASGQRGAGLAAAEQAIGVAVGEQVSLCLSISDDIKAGKTVTWKFN